MAGKLYGTGVGPGDPELLTLKALEIIKECAAVAFPGKSPESSTAFNIALKAYPKIKDKELLGIYMPMTKNEEILLKSHEDAAKKICRVLDEGKDIAFLTLGDPALYSTYIYIHERVVQKGYEAVIINGVPSFCAAAAALGISLGQKDEQIHIIPASYEEGDALSLSGTKVFMKAGRSMGDLKKLLIERGAQAVMAENCTMEGERLYIGAENFPEDAGYYSLIIVKDKA